MELEDLQKYKHIHLIGIGGVSMSAVAETLKNWNFIVTGSDIAQSELTDKLIENGIKVTIGHDVESAKNADLIVYSAAINDQDPEIIAAKENNIPLIGRGEFVGLITKKYKETICVAGTHGKTSTTSMLAICFIDAHKDPSVQVGAILKNIDGNYVIGNSDYFILESCEYKGNFLKFFPKTEIILNIDNDHLDYYKTFENVINAFRDFSKILPENGLLVTNADDENCIKLREVTKSKMITFGIDNKDADFRADNITFDNNGFPTFDVYKNNEFYETITLCIAGRHNVLNSLSVIATCDYYGISKESIKSSLLKFKGASRRLEFKGKINDASIFDDYAHHPTEIEAISKAIKNKTYNKSWVIFQPHTYSRTKEHLDSFAKVLSEFDNVVLVDIYAAREKNTIGISSKDLSDKINELNHDKSTYISDFNDVVKYIKSHAQKDDIIITLGAGTVTELGPMLAEK